MIKWSFDDSAIGVMREDGKTLEPNSRMTLSGWYAFASLVVGMLNAKEARIAELESRVESLEAELTDTRYSVCECGL